MAHRMSEDEREKAFPIHIEMEEDGPVLDLGQRAAAVNLPESGCALVDFVRNEDGTLRVKTVCLESGESEDDDEPMDLDEALDQVAESDDEPEGEEYDEEDE